MRIITAFIFTLLLSNFADSASLSEYFHHDIPQPVLLGETARIELQSFTGHKNYYNGALFYRMQGESDFHSLKMNEEGFILYAAIDTKKLRSGNIEYYFAFQSAAGEAAYLPETAPRSGFYQLRILPAKGQQKDSGKNLLEILLLTPEPNETINPEDFIIALSIPLDTKDIKTLKYRLLIDGVDYSKYLKSEGNLITFDPQTFRSGLHNAEFKVINAAGGAVGKKQWSFRLSGQPSKGKGFNSQTSVFLDNRYQNISEKSDNYFRSGVDFSGSYKKFNFRTRFLISSEEASDRQPVNIYSINILYNFTSATKIYLKGGDLFTNYNPLVFWNKRIRGFGAGFKSKYFNLDITYGQNTRGVEGKAVMVERATSDTTTALQDSTTQYGVYKQTFLGIRPQFNFGRHVSWALNLVNGKDDPNSIQYAANPKESLVLGTTLKLNFHQNRISFLGSFQASIKNEDAAGTVEFDSLAEKFNLTGSEKDLAETFYNILDKTGFLTLSPGLAPIPSLAMQFETQLKYFNHFFRFTYKKIDTEYSTPGNPYLLKDIEGIFINDNIRLLKNQVFLNLYFKSYNDNLSQGNAKTKNVDVGGSISYFPLQNIPSITLTYGNLSRNNDIDPTSADSIFFKEDNTTQRIGISSSYNFATGPIRNTATLSASKFKRDDGAYDQNQSDFTLYTIGLRNKFAFPFTSKFSFTKTASSLYRTSVDTTTSELYEATTDIQKFFIGFDYSFRKVVNNSDIKPFLNMTIQKISNNDSSVEDYNRTNYTAGIYARNPKYGNLSLRYDYINFGDRADWNDNIISARYEINF